MHIFVCWDGWDTPDTKEGGFANWHQLFLWGGGKRVTLLAIYFENTEVLLGMVNSAQLNRTEWELTVYLESWQFITHRQKKKEFKCLMPSNGLSNPVRHASFNNDHNTGNGKGTPSMYNTGVWVPRTGAGPSACLVNSSYIYIHQYPQLCTELQGCSSCFASCLKPDLQEQMCNTQVSGWI